MGCVENRGGGLFSIIALILKDNTTDAEVLQINID